MESSTLQRRIEGKVIGAQDAAYETLRRQLSWNQLTPARYPQLVVQAANENDVVEAIRFARAQRMKAAVRGGGHSWVGFSIRDGGILIDLSRLARAAIDAEARLAHVQPAVKGRDLMQQLAPAGLAFPVGHAPSVPVSGFLLNGGLGWNFNKWGPACFSIEAARVVLADGNIVVANDENHTDLLWAVRGAGPGFFGVVTEYTLRLYQAPGAIRTSSYFYSLQQLEHAGAWAATVATRMPAEVELTLFVAPAPPPLAGQGESGNGFVAILNATAFLDTEAESAATLDLLEEGPLGQACLHKEVNQPVTFDALLDLGGALWPERHRYRVDTVWSDMPAVRPLSVVRDAFLKAPSRKSLALCVFSTGGKDRAALPDAAYSMAAAELLLCYAIWESPESDSQNAAWHRELIAGLDSFAAGHYVGESDIVAEPSRAQRSFAPANWERLRKLRRKYDPDGRFHGHFDEAPDRELHSNSAQASTTSAAR